MFFLGVDGMAQPIINIGVPQATQGDPFAAQRPLTSRATHENTLVMRGSLDGGEYQGLAILA